jgi:cytochrome P450
MGWEWIMPAARYDESWRHSRKLLDRGLRPRPLAAYRPMLQLKARVLLTRLLASADEWETHLELSVCSYLCY